MKRFLSLLSLLLVIPFLSSSPVEAHTDDSPHVPIAEYNGFNKVVLDKDPDVYANWDVFEVGNELDLDINGGPNVVMGECESQGGKCIVIHQINTSNKGHISGQHNTGSPDIVWLNIHGDFVANRAATCKILSLMWGMHEHTRPSGCSRIDFTFDNIHISDAEEIAFDVAYCPPVGCRIGNWN